MPLVFARAPGKIILFGEHAVVYGQPAIAIPVLKVSATARVLPRIGEEPGQILIEAPDIQQESLLSELPEDDPLAAAIRITLAQLNIEHPPAFTLQISATIPTAAGMGSGAAVTVAIIRALSAFLGRSLPPRIISSLAYEVEKIHHGTPSGIDNTVVSYEKPVYFVRGEVIQILTIEQETQWIIGDTGERTPTRDTVSAVRELHAANAERCEEIFEKIGEITRNARKTLRAGDWRTLGNLMNENQCLLEQLSVSSPSLDRLIQAAQAAGAAGAKLSGGGRGGNMIALAPPKQVQAIQSALKEAGATNVITTILRKSP